MTDKTAGHTPGPWKIDGFQILGNDEMESLVCDIHPDIFKSGENSSLIAAAPELLEALRYLVEANRSHNYQHDGCDICAGVKNAKSVISKAEGR